MDARFRTRYRATLGPVVWSFFCWPGANSRALCVATTAPMPWQRESRPGQEPLHDAPGVGRPRLYQVSSVPVLRLSLPDPSLPVPSGVRRLRHRSSSPASRCCQRRPSCLPRKAVRLIVGYSPGSGTDLVARAITPYLEKFYGSGARIVIVNRTGTAARSLHHDRQRRPRRLHHRLRRHAAADDHPDRAHEPGTHRHQRRRTGGTIGILPITVVVMGSGLSPSASPGMTVLMPRSSRIRSRPACCRCRPWAARSSRRIGRARSPAPSGSR